jgi:hypothetical protein
LADAERGRVAERDKVGESVAGVAGRGQERGADGSGRRFLWATCGDWDLNTVVPRQCFPKERSIESLHSRIYQHTDV